MSLIGNLSVYLTTKYNLGGVFLVNVINIWFGSCNVLSIGGAFVSDAYLGRFWTLLLGSIASVIVIFPSFLFIFNPVNSEEETICVLVFAQVGRGLVP